MIEARVSRFKTEQFVQNTQRLEKKLTISKKPSKPSVEK